MAGGVVPAAPDPMATVPATPTRRLRITGRRGFDVKLETAPDDRLKRMYTMLKAFILPRLPLLYGRRLLT